MSTELATELADAEARIERTLLSERAPLRQRWEAMQRRASRGQPFDRDFTRFRDALAQATARYEQREKLVPTIRYPAELPVVERREELLKLIGEHQVVIVCGETGSGKSTQLPKLCLELGRGIAGAIGHTQPRRIAARSIATRVAQELQVPLGQQVGYKVRFADQTGPNTLIKLMTDGLLLAETQSDRRLLQYDTLIVDEAHERSLNIDFVLGYLHQLLPQRPDLKVIITSATIDAERFRQHFSQVVGEVPVATVSGRMFPVEVRYRPLAGDAETIDAADEWAHLVSAVDEACDADPGDVLVFLPTERDIHEAVKRLRARFATSDRTELLPLYARLSVQEQQRVFQTSSRRRIVLATNVAESSLTVPGIRTVVDTGTARISRYSPRSRVQRLPIEAVSQASADQRAGRCGRVGPGVCIRLYAGEDYLHRERYTAPEIQRANLAAVILQTLHLGLGGVEAFPFLDPPRRDAVRDGYHTLFEIGAVTEEFELTPLGRKLSPLPVDPRIGRIILAGIETHSLPEVMIIAAALSVQDPRERPADKKGAADQAHAQFVVPDSDFLSLVKIWDVYHEWKQNRSRNQLRKTCVEHFLSPVRMQEWCDVHRELQDIVHDLGARPGPRHNDYAATHRALLTGFLSGLATRTEQGDFLGTGNQRAVMWPGSVLSQKKPKWVFAAETVETTRRYLRIGARIDPAWIEPLAGHLLKYTHTEPHYDRDAEATMAYERVTLLGLPIVARRRMRYARVDAPKSREMFVVQALVTGDMDDPPEFLVQNLALTQSLLEWQARLRRPILVVEEEQRAAFYQERLPADIVDGQKLRHWYGRASSADRQRVLMTERDLLVSDADAIVLERFPEALTLGELRLPLTYRHDLAAENDGVTLTVPHAALNQLDADRLEWLVPGLLREKYEALLKTLPKEERRMINPVQETAKGLFETIPYAEGNLVEQLATALREKYGMRVYPRNFSPEKLPDHLLLRVEVVDAEGVTIGAGRNLSELQRRFGALAAARFAAQVDTNWHADQQSAWTFGGLPEKVACVRGGLAMTGYPAVVDQAQAVGVRLFDTPERAAREHRLGVRRLTLIARRKALRQQIDHLPLLRQWALLSRRLPQPCALVDHTMELLAERAFLDGVTLPRNQHELAALLDRGHARLAPAAAEIILWLGSLFEALGQLWPRLEKFSPASFEMARQDVDYQLARLVAPGFLAKTPWNWLIHLPRYLNGISLRIDKALRGQRDRDLQSLQEVWPYWRKVVERETEHQRRQLFDPELETARWMVEEFRIGLFAQELGTALPVSSKRLDQQWERVSR